MVRKFLMILLGFFIISSSFLQFTSAVLPGEIYEDSVVLSYRNVTVYAPAVAETENGYVGEQGQKDSEDCSRADLSRDSHR